MKIHYSSSMMDTALLEDSASLLSDDAYDKTGDDLLTSRRRSKRKSRSAYTSKPEPPVLTDTMARRYPTYPTAPPLDSSEPDKTPPKRRKVSQCSLINKPQCIICWYRTCHVTYRTRTVNVGTTNTQ